jgi:hypothetical protein
MIVRVTSPGAIQRRYQRYVCVGDNSFVCVSVRPITIDPVVASEIPIVGWVIVVPTPLSEPAPPPAVVVSLW